jgi:hypothetical protein
MPEMLCHRHLGGIDLPRSGGLVKGNVAASIAMTASRVSLVRGCEIPFLNAEMEKGAVNARPPDGHA